MESIYSNAQIIASLEATIVAHETEVARLTHAVADAERERDEARVAFTLRDRQYRELLAEAKAALS